MKKTVSSAISPRLFLPRRSISTPSQRYEKSGAETNFHHRVAGQKNIRRKSSRRIFSVSLRKQVGLQQGLHHFYPALGGYTHNGDAFLRHGHCLESVVIAFLVGDPCALHRKDLNPLDSLGGFYVHHSVEGRTRNVYRGFGGLFDRPSSAHTMEAASSVYVFPLSSCETTGRTVWI